MSDHPGEYAPLRWDCSACLPGEGCNTIESRAQRLFEAGQQRAHERAERVRDLRIDRTHPLVLAVLERWGWDPPTVSDALAEQAVSAVQAVVNCLGSRPEQDEVEDA